MNTVKRGDTVVFKPGVQTWGRVGDKFDVISVDKDGNAYVAPCYDWEVPLPCRVENLELVKMPWEE